MKKNMKKATALFLSAAMAAGMLTGCGSKSGGNSGDFDPNISLDEHVELTMYLLGDDSPVFQEVYAEINKILDEKLNTTVNVKFLGWGEHDTAYSLLFAGGEDFDLIFTASSWGHYESTVAMDGFYPMSEEFIKTYAPDIWEVVPELAWDQAKINGNIYMVPNYQNEFGQDVLAVRGDLMKEYGIDQITNWDELVAFYEACAKHGMYASQGGPWYQFFQSQGLTTTGGAPSAGDLILYKTQDPNDLSFYYMLDWDGFSEYCHEMKRLADMGAWSRDVLNSSDERQDGLLNGRTAAMIWNMGTCKKYAKDANRENPEWNVTLVDPVSNQAKKVNSYINNGVAINAASKNKERAMMVLNEFYTNPTVNDMSRFGIEGKHWEAVGDDQYKILEGSEFGLDNYCNWGWMNNEIKRTEYVENRTPVDDTYDAMLASWDNNVKGDHVYDGFNFDSTAVATEFAAVEAALGQYYDPLKNGLVDDVDVALEQLKNALENAGIRDVIAELEKQAAEYVASKQ